MHICVMAIDVSTIIPLNFGTVQTMRYFLSYYDNYIFGCLNEPTIDSHVLYLSIY